MSLTKDTNTSTETITYMDTFHTLSNSWCLWGHLPHDTDWSISSYKKIYTFRYVEEVLAVTETLPDILVKNCMLFLMRNGIKPTWEDPRNRNGGCFSYKVSNKNVYEVWKELTYVIVGETVSEQKSFVSCVSGVTVSPKKNFCIIKIWMTNCLNQNAGIITNEIKGLSPLGCIFKKHSPEY